jgi:hypothetical protein
MQGIRMMACRKKRSAYRRERSDIELTARRHALLYPSMLDALPDEAITLAEEILDAVATVQRTWDPQTEWLRARGFADLPWGSTAEQVAKSLHLGPKRDFPPITRVFSVDRPLIDFSHWFRQDVDEELPPDEYEPEVERAMRGVRGIWVGAGVGPDTGPMPSDDAVPLGPAHAWEDAPDWLFTTYKLESPLDAHRAQQFDVRGDVVLRLDEQGRSYFVRGAKKAPRTPPTS